jgi:RNA polymerase sigma-70 factor (ECF subfamily)
MPMIQLSRERALIRRARKGDGQAIAALIQAHQDALYAFMLRMSGKPDLAEDICQEAFVRVLRNLDRFDTRFRFSTWLFTIAKRLYVNWMQKHKPAYDSDMVGAQGCSTRNPSTLTADEESMDNARSIIDTALGELTAQQREIVVLFHQLDWPIIDIAAHLDMPEGTVKSHLHRARRRMRKALESNSVLHAQVREVWT